MQLPQWTKNGNDTFWRRHYELANATEEACSQTLEGHLQQWLAKLERTEGPGAIEEK